jgi:hypothetical protein
MFKDIPPAFLSRYSANLALTGFSFSSLQHAVSSCTLTMVSSDYILTFVFYNELPCKLIVDIKKQKAPFKINPSDKCTLLNDTLSFFPFNLEKHCFLDNLQYDILRNLDVYDLSAPIIDYFSSRFNNDFYNLRYPIKSYTVYPSLGRMVSSSSVSRFDAYSLHVNSEGEVYYTARVNFTFPFHVFYFNNHDDLYIFDGKRYTADQLHTPVFKAIVDTIQSEIFNKTDIQIEVGNEGIIRNAINVYKMVNI